MARPVGLLRAMEPDAAPILSWSTVAAPTLVLGRAAGRPPVDHAAAEAAGVTVVQRSSGGGPVLWDADLIGLDVILPPGHPLAPADVIAAYRWLGEAIASALTDLGLPAVTTVSVAASRAAGAAPGPAAAACYGGVSPFEVLVAGRKVVGLSQARRRPGTLLQVGLLLGIDGPLTARLMGRDNVFAAALSRHAAGLREWLPDLCAPDLIAAVDASVAARLGGTPAIGELPDAPTAAEQAAIAIAMAELTDPGRP